MSESYTHYLISSSKSYSPAPHSIGQFLEGIIQSGGTGSDYRIECLGVLKNEQQFREIRNPFTGKTTKIRTPPRKKTKKGPVSTITEAIKLVEREQEYDIALISTVPPINPPLDIGYIQDGTWISYTEPYHLEICCHIRKSLVRLSSFKPGDSPNAPLTELDFATDRWPTLDEDCTEDDKDGLFVHPEALDGIPIPNAGCGRFWIEFEYGKWIYPQLKNNSLNLLKPKLIELAKETFGTPFIEACSWG